MQYVPEEGVYVYFRYDARQTVMCVMNTNDTAMNIQTARFEERLKGFTKARDVTTNQTTPIKTMLMLPAKTELVMELQ
jgi:rRNA processing protein Krr1/Pno1